MSRRENVPTHTVNKSPRQLKGNENAFLLFSLRLSYCVGGGGRILPEPIVADWPISNRWKYDDALALFRLGWWCWWLATHRKSKKKKKTTQRLAQPLVLFFDFFFPLKKKENKFLFIYFLFGWWLLAARPRSGQGSFLFFFLLLLFYRVLPKANESCVLVERERIRIKEFLSVAHRHRRRVFIWPQQREKKLNIFWIFVSNQKKSRGVNFSLLVHWCWVAQCVFPIFQVDTAVINHLPCCVFPFPPLLHLWLRLTRSHFRDSRLLKKIEINKAEKTRFWCNGAKKGRRRQEKRKLSVNPADVKQHFLSLSLSFSGTCVGSSLTVNTQEEEPSWIDDYAHASVSLFYFLIYQQTTPPTPFTKYISFLFFFFFGFFFWLVYTSAFANIV